MDCEWTPETIRENVNNWTLASDAGVLCYLQKFSEKLSTRAKTTLTDIDELFNDLTNTKIQLANVTNQFMNLHHTQFIERRVYEEDETIINTPEVVTITNKDTTPNNTENIELMRKVIQDGLHILNKHFERVEVTNSDSDDESEEPSIIVRPKELFMNRPLPYVIGSKEWFECDHVGLKPSDSSESLDDDDDNDNELESDSLQNSPKLHIDGHGSSDESINDNDITPDVFISSMPESAVLPSSNDVFNNSSSSDTEPNARKVDKKFVSELANKLGNVEHNILPDDNDVYGRSDGKSQQTSSEKIKAPTNSSYIGLFADEPPPLDEVDRRDLFGTSAGFSSYNTSGGGGGLFDDLNDDDDLWSQQISTNKNVQNKLIKNDLFGDTENQLSENKQNQNFFTKNKNQSKNLFDNDSDDDDDDDDDLFTIKTDSNKKLSYFPTVQSTIMPLIDDQPPPDDVQQNKTNDKCQLSSESESDNEPSVIPESTTSKAHKFVSLFDDDDNDDANNKKCTSIFDDDDDDIDFLTSKLTNKQSESSKTDLFSNEKLESFEKSLFFDDEPPPIDTNDKQNIVSSNKKAVDLFKEVDDTLFQSNDDVTTNIFDDLSSDSQDNSNTNKTDDIFKQKAAPSLFDNQKTDEIKKNPIPIVKSRTHNDLVVKFESTSEKQTIKDNTSAPGKLKHNLNINVAALMPGASIKQLKSDKKLNENVDATEKPQGIITTTMKITKSISFEEQLGKVETLQNLTQERARIPVKRRPSSRRARQEALRVSAIDFDVNQPDEIDEIQPNSDDKLTSDESMNNKTIETENNQDRNDLFSESTNKFKSILQDIENDEDDDLFSSITNKIDEQITDEKVKDDIFTTKPVLDLTKSLLSDNDDLFSGAKDKKDITTKTDTKSKSEVVKSLFSDSDDDDLFKPKPVKSIVQKNKLSQKSLFGDEDDDSDDLFGSRKTVQKDVSDNKSGSTTKIVKPTSEIVFNDPLMLQDD